MLHFTIKNNRHYSNNWIWKSLSSFWARKKRFSYNVVFHRNCKYILNSEDQEDINKLYGVCFGLNPHNNSMRFGWNYSIELDKINLYSYCYINGKREYKFLCSVDVDKEYTLCIHTLSKEKALFTVICSETSKIAQRFIVINKTKNWGVNLWPYFGGNNAAPHNITISLEEH